MITLARIFQEGLTLQRQKPIRIWGDTDQPQTVTVLLNDEALLENAFIEGSFSLLLPPQEAMTDASLTIQGSADRLELKDVNIGEVWIAGGQSNMEFLLRYDAESKKSIASADDNDLRFYDVGEYSFPEEERQSHKDNTGWDKWLKFRPEWAGYFSAVGAYFCKELRENLHVPVAIVGCNWAGSTASGWLDESYLSEDPDLRTYLDDYAEATKGMDMDEYIRKNDETLAFMESPLMVYAADAILRGLTLRDILKLLPIAKDLASFSIPMGPRNPYSPGCLYRAMVSQIAGYACRGVIWYQGESDVGKADIYDKLFSAMIRCWRDAWQDELPFLFVQIAPFGKWLGSNGDEYPRLRDKQELVSKTVSGCYMASIMDVGMEKDIHPKQKAPVGHRLALLARGKIYGEDLLCEAPEFISADVKTGELSLTFAGAGEGLFIRGCRLSALELTVDQKPVRFRAVCEGYRLILRSRAITESSRICVNFARVGYCKVNLYSSAGLPAKPFTYTI